MANDDNTDHYEGAVLEDIRDQLAAILESQQLLKDVPRDIAIVKEDITEIKSDLQAIKAAVKDHSKQFDNHEDRITTLEQTTA